MNELQLFLIPQPGAKPEFLATLQVVDPSPAVVKIWRDHLITPALQQPRLVDDKNNNSNNNNKSHALHQLNLENYTRDGWAWKPIAGSTQIFVEMTVQAIDGRNKLPSFVNYLQQRQKSAYGRFAPSGVLVVSYIQPKKNDGIDNNKKNPTMQCRVCLDVKQIKDCSLQPLGNISSINNSDHGNSRFTSSIPPTPLKPSQASKAGGGGGGLLGKLVGAQQRTNQNVALSQVRKRCPPRPTGTAAIDVGETVAAVVAVAGAVGDDENDYEGGVPSAGAGQEVKTAQQVLADFRTAMQEKMIDFEMAEDEDVLKVSIILSDYVQGWWLEHERSKVSMEILKYMVYEAAEEVNEEWIAHKEPSEFMDEAVVVVYKEGAAPPEVLEEINRAELPDEIRGQQRAIQEERQRLVSQAEMRQKQQLESQALRGGLDGGIDDQGGDVEALNKNKRDRRSVEDYEREKRLRKS